MVNIKFNTPGGSGEAVRSSWCECHASRVDEERASEASADSSRRRGRSIDAVVRGAKRMAAELKALHRQISFGGAYFQHRLVAQELAELVAQLALRTLLIPR